MIHACLRHANVYFNTLMTVLPKAGDFMVWTPKEPPVMVQRVMPVAHLADTMGDDRPDVVIEVLPPSFEDGLTLVAKGWKSYPAPAPLSGVQKT